MSLLSLIIVWRTGMAGQLHQVLALEATHKTTATKILNETDHTFKSRTHLFFGKTTAYTPEVEGDQDIPDIDQVNLGTSVKEKLDYTFDLLGRAINSLCTKEKTNTQASAPIVVKDDDGKVLLEIPDVPVVVLVQLETRFRELRTLFLRIPTLPLTQKWEWDDNQNCWVSQPVRKRRTRKIRKNHEIAPATDKHPAQVEVYTEDIPVGTFTMIDRSGAIKISTQSETLRRLDMLIDAIKIARAKANEHEIQDLHPAHDIFAYLMEPINTEMK